jgi:hypothetical protein
VVDDSRLQILAALDRRGVRYLVVGGYAAQLHGVDHVTDDVDITPIGEPENLRRLANALNEMRARFRVERYPDGFRPPVRIDARGLQKMESATFVTTHGNLDVIMTVDGLGGYDALAERAEQVRPPDMGGRIVTVIALGDLIISKRAAGRPKDQALLPLLEELASRRAE